MDLTRLDDLRTAMKLAGIKPRKELGQHFLIDHHALNAMLASARLSKEDIVLEIGPGLGVMTLPLALAAGQVIAVEADPGLADLLRRAHQPNLTVVTEDFMKYDLRALPAGYKVVANIPYYLTSRIFRLLLESENKPTSITMLIQKEVAERVVAEPGQMSILALSVQYYGKPKLVQTVERHKFWPAPLVDSAILHIAVRSKPAFPADPDRLFRLVKAGFGERRKQLHNSLAGGLNMTVDATHELLEAAEIKSTARPQELSMKDWHHLYSVSMKRKVLG